MPYYRVTSFRMMMEEVVNDVQAGNASQAKREGDAIADKGGGKIESREVYIPICSTQAEKIVVPAR